MHACRSTLEDPTAGEEWLAHCLSRAAELGYATDRFGDREAVLDRINVDVAASTQKLFEETLLAAAGVLHRLLAGLGRPAEAVCLSGGTALSCPTNTRIARETPFTRCFVEPACDDSGLAAGAALWAAHNLSGNGAGDRRAAVAMTAYQGKGLDAAEVEAAFESFRDRIEVDRPDDWAGAAADALAADRIVAWCEGRSEVGPRALGHRSLLADPRPAANWQRVNRIKGREAWRPLAPAALADAAADWFREVPLPSPHMLYTGKVARPGLEAVTHVDGTARIQTVDASCGAFHRLLLAFQARTGCPVVLNTSLNGPGEPIVQSAADALRFFLGSACDELFLEGFRVRRRDAGADARRTP